MVNFIQTSFPKQIHRIKIINHIAKSVKYYEDKDLFFFAIKQLLDNALKFSQESEVSIELLSNTHELHTERLQIAIKDHGIGIDDLHLEQITSYFFQIDASNTRKFGGLGLGLPIAYRIVNELKGEISIQSKLGQGTEVCMTLFIEKA